MSAKRESLSPLARRQAIGGSEDSSPSACRKCNVPISGGRSPPPFPLPYCSHWPQKSRPQVPMALATRRRRRRQSKVSESSRTRLWGSSHLNVTNSGRVPEFRHHSQLPPSDHLPGSKCACMHLLEAPQPVLDNPVIRKGALEQGVLRPRWPRGGSGTGHHRFGHTVSNEA